jgi:hypothetical protein
VSTSLYLRRLVAVLSIAVLLLAAVSPASGLPCAILTPLALLAVSILFAEAIRQGEEPGVQPLALRRLVLARAPPVA